MSEPDVETEYLKEFITYSEASECCCAPELDSWVAKYAPGRTELTVQEIFDLAMKSTDREKSGLVIYLERFPVDLAMKLAETVGPFYKGRIAGYSDLPMYFRKRMAMGSSPEWKDSLVYLLRGYLTTEELAQMGTLPSNVVDEPDDDDEEQCGVEDIIDLTE